MPVSKEVFKWCCVILQSEWEKATDKRIKSNTIARRVEKLMQRGTFSLEDRRERLVFTCSAKRSQISKH